MNILANAPGMPLTAAFDEPDRALDESVPSLEPREPRPSPAGPVEADSEIRMPPAVRLYRILQLIQFSQRQVEFVFRSRRELGEVFKMSAGIEGSVVVTSHPEHARSLFTARPELVPSLTGESALRPIVGPDSVLTTNGPAHLRQRRLLLPSFHGDAIDRFSEMIERATDNEIERWPIGEPLALAPRMQAITLQVIMSGVFGIDGTPARGTPEGRLAAAIKYLTIASTSWWAKIAEIANTNHSEPVGLNRIAIAGLDRAIFAAIDARRRAPDLDARSDILSLLLRTTDEDGAPLTDRELRDQLVTLLLAGFETTANSLAWTWERLMRAPRAKDALITAVREDDDADTWIDATIYEAMRARPVVPIVGRRVQETWQLGDYVVPPETAIAVSILLLHHREDLYPEPFAFRPDRWLGRTPGTYEWIPFGGGTRRCLGATLAMAELRIVLRTMARRLDLVADAPEAERAQHRNVTMIPARGARAMLVHRGSA